MLVFLKPAELVSLYASYASVFLCFLFLFKASLHISESM